MEWLKEFADLGGTVVVSLAVIWLFYESMKAKKVSGSNKESSSKNSCTMDNKGIGEALEGLRNEMNLTNTNHLHSIELTIKDGHAEIVKTINEGNMKMIEKLSELCGTLKNLK
jgi:hypothetical protein